MGQKRAFGLREVVVGCAIVVGLSLLLAWRLLPMLAVAVPCGGGASARRAICRSNLKQIGLAVAMYQNDFGGWFPTMGPDAPKGQERSLAGMSLLHGCYITASKVFVCPATDDRSQSVGKPVAAAMPDNHRHSIKPLTRAGCSYAYDPRKRPDTPPDVAIASDKPGRDNPGTRNSVNHNNTGQNVLYFDGHVEWGPTPNVGHKNDNIFTGKWDGPAGALASTDTYCVLN